MHAALPTVRLVIGRTYVLGAPHASNSANTLYHSIWAMIHHVLTDGQMCPYLGEISSK